MKNYQYLSDKYQNLMEVGKRDAETYKTNSPFPNIHFNNFFNSEFLESVLKEFPDLAQKSGVKRDNEKEIKFAGRGEYFLGENTKLLVHFLNSEVFLHFLQELTGIKETLLGDPYLYGGGQHQINRGGLLKIHADFNKHPKTGLDRRINALVYLNKNWEDEFGGNLELWDENMEKCVKQIPPVFNTLAIFSTTDFSYHGHPDPLNCPENRNRKSLAFYYYSNGRPESEINWDLKSHSTLFQQRKANKNDKVAFQKFKARTSYLKSMVKEITPPILLKGLKKIF